MGMASMQELDFDGVGIAFGAVSLEILTSVAGAAAFMAVVAGLSPRQASAAVSAAVHDAMLRRAAPTGARLAPVYVDTNDFEGFECCDGCHVDLRLAECEEPEVENFDDDIRRHHREVARDRAALSEHEDDVAFDFSKLQ